MKFVLLLFAVVGSSLAFPPSHDDETDFIGIRQLSDISNDNVDTDDHRIIGGTPAPIGQFPWMLSLRNGNTHVCGASILSARRALTAAQCIDTTFPPARYNVLAGSSFVWGECAGTIARLSRYVLHPQFNRRTLQNDVAVILLARPLPLGLTVKPIAIAAQNAPVPVGATAQISGWGRTSETTMAQYLKFTTEPVITNQHCNSIYRGRVTNAMLCAGVPGGNGKVCEGDNGGPLVVNGVQIGIVSWGEGCGRPNRPSVYARVAAFSNWIQSVTT